MTEQLPQTTITPGGFVLSEIQTNVLLDCTIYFTGKNRTKYNILNQKHLTRRYADYRRIEFYRITHMPETACDDRTATANKYSINTPGGFFCPKFILVFRPIVQYIS